jgi:HK97 family phage major capsid protein
VCAAFFRREKLKNTETRASLISQAEALLRKNPYSREDDAKFRALMTLAEATGIQEASTDRYRSAQAGALMTEEQEAAEKSFRSYIRTGKAIAAPELRTYSPLGDGNAASFIPEQWKSQYQARLASSAGILKAGATTIELKSGAKYLSFYSDDVSNSAEILAEQAQLNDAANPANPVASVNSPTVVKFATSTQISTELLQDSAFDADAFLQNLFGIRVSRKFNNYASVDGTAGVLSQFSLGATTAGAVPTIAELVNMQDQIDSAYVLESDSAPVYTMSPAMRVTLMQQVGSDGRRLYPEIAKGELLGFPLVVNVDQPYSAGSIAVCFGSFKRALLVQSTPQILVRSIEKYAEFGTVYFALFHRMGIKLVDADAVTALALHS